MKSCAVLYFSILACYLLTAGGHLYSPDEELLFRTTRSLATEGTLAIEPLGDAPNADHFGTRKPATPRADGREYAQYGIGQPILAIPFYWIGAGLSHFGSDAAWQRMTGWADGTAKELAPRWACSWFNIFLGPLLAVMVYLIALEMGSERQAAMIASLLYALGSLAWAHSRPFFTESCAALFILIAWLAVLRGLRGNLVAWCGLGGAAAGYAALVRMDSVFAYAGLGILLVGPAVRCAKDRRQSLIAAWAAFAISAAFCGALFLRLNRLHFGGATQTGYADQPEGLHFSSPFLPGIYGLLFSAGKGIFFFSPALALSFFGWRPLLHVLLESPSETVRRQPMGVWWGLMAAVVVPLCVHAKWPNWAGGWCWGPRHIFLIHPFLALPIAAWLTSSWSGAVRIATAVFGLIGVGVQLLGCSQDFISFYDRFFRRMPGPEFSVLYDPMDQAYWGAYYQLSGRPSPAEPYRPVRLFPPAPTQYSVFVPQNSVWSGYPVMLREGNLDNFWARLLREDPAANPPADGGAGDQKSAP